MKLYLVQHGKALEKDVDPERGLSPEGITDVTRIAETAKHYRVPIDRIWHSGKKRALQTAEIFQQVTGSRKGFGEKTGMGPTDDVKTFATELSIDNLMLVGHLPFMSRLTSYLVTGNSNIPIFAFQNGGIVCLHKERGNNEWIIKWALMPNVG